MKKFKLWGLALFLGIVLISNNIFAADLTSRACTSYTANSFKSVNTSDKQPVLDYYAIEEYAISTSKMFDPGTLNEVEQLSDTVITGTFLNTLKQEDIYSGHGSYLYGYTKSSVRVDKVYSGNLNVGDVITVLEPYAIHENVLLHYENFYPSQSDKVYIWFLEKNTEPDMQGIYTIVVGERGRYPILNDNARSASDISAMSSRDLDLSPNGDTTVYKKIYSEVVGKYLKK